MKTLAVIKNELFQDYLKIISTDDLPSTLDNPSVPVPFVCVTSVENSNSDVLAVELNKFFNHKKLNKKDFLCLDKDDLSQLHFLFNIVQISGGGSPMITTTTVDTPVAKPIVETPTFVEPLAVTPEPITVKQTELVAEPTTNSPSADVELIASLNIPPNSLIHFIKNEDITAHIVDESTVIYEGEELGIVDATKKAFKKSGRTGMAMGLANWNYEGNSLKSLKDKK